MSRAWPARTRRAILAVVSIVLLVAAGAQAATAAGSNPPVVSNGLVTPTQLPHSGGFVTVSADVDSDAPGLNLVWAKLAGPDGSISDGPALTQFSGGNTWEGMVELPANSTPVPVTWKLSVRARDLDNQESEADVGTVQVAALPPDTPPTVGDPSVAPRSLSHAGGPVALGVSATDVEGIFEAYATVTGPHGFSRTVPLPATTAHRYAGTFSAPRNTGRTAVRYAVTLTAMDTVGHLSSVGGGAVTVAGRPLGRLQVSTALLRFGPTHVGRARLRTLVIRNVGPASAAPVSGSVWSSGAPFRVLTASPAAHRFTLAAGRSISFVVRFLPRRTGARHGELHIRRRDGLPELVVQLRGRGTR